MRAHFGNCVALGWVLLVAVANARPFVAGQTPHTRQLLQQYEDAYGDTAAVPPAPPEVRCGTRAHVVMVLSCCAQGAQSIRVALNSRLR